MIKEITLGKDDFIILLLNNPINPKELDNLNEALTSKNLLLLDPSIELIIIHRAN